MAISLKKETYSREYTPEHIREEYVPQIEVRPIEARKNNNLPMRTESDDNKPALSRRAETIINVVWDIMKVVLVSSVLGVIVLCFVGFLKDGAELVSDVNTYGNAIDEISGGVIVDKRIINQRSNAINTYPTEYRIYIEGEYEWDGEKLSIQKYFCVPESTYLAYDIGDYFNSQDFRTTTE